MKKPRIVSALWFLLLVNYLDRVALGFAGPSIMKSLALTPAAFGVVLSSFSVGYMLAIIPGGVVADKWGAKAVLVIGPLFWAVFTGATGLVATVAGFVIVRICFGLSEGLSVTSYSKTIGDNFEPRQRARTLAICSSATSLAPLFAGALVGGIVQTYGWRMVFFIMMAPAVVCAFINYSLLPSRRSAPPPPVGASGDEPNSFREVLKRPSLWLFSMAALAWNIPYWGYLGWMPSYLALDRHIHLKALGPISSIPYVFAFVGMLVGGFLGSTRLLHRYCAPMIAFAFTCAGACLFVAYQARIVSLSLAGLSGAAFFLYGCQGLEAKVGLDLAPERFRAGYIAVYSTAGQIGGVLAPAIIGLLVSATGAFASGFGFMIAALGVSAICLLALTPYLLRMSPSAGIPMTRGSRVGA